MDVINLELPDQAYSIFVGQNILPGLADLLEERHSARQIAVITSRSIYELHGKKLLDILNRDQRIVEILFVPDGESAKSFSQVQHLYTRLLESHFERNSVILAFGGGVIGDLAGFVAATYLRGVDFVQVPTTLLAQVDSSIGGKVGVNHPLGKNLIGAFKQPLFVLSDVELLKSLPDSEIRCGLGEIVKYGFILNEPFFSYIEKHLQQALAKEPGVLAEMVKVSSREKAGVVARDEKEANLRMILNFGHTFGHALEAEFKFGQLKHGEAVILGMKCALAYAFNTGRLPAGDYQRGTGLLDRIPVPFDRRQLYTDRLIDRMTHDKKVRNSKIRLVLVDKIGSHYMESEPEISELRKAFQVLY